MDLQDSVQRSLQKPAEKILQICTDSQRKKKKKKKKTLYFQLEIVLKNAIPFQEAVYMYNISVKKRN